MPATRQVARRHLNSIKLSLPSIVTHAPLRFQAWIVVVAMAAAGAKCVVLGDAFLVGDQDSVGSALSKQGYKVVVSTNDEIRLLLFVCRPNI